MSVTAVRVGGPYDGQELLIADEQARPGTEIFHSEGRAGRRRHVYIATDYRDDSDRVVFGYLECRELPALTLPETAWFNYGGRRFDVRRFLNADEFPWECPRCGFRSCLTHQPGTYHTIEVAPDGAMTVTPSIGCGSIPYCGWHVMITAGEARDV